MRFLIISVILFLSVSLSSQTEVLVGDSIIETSLIIKKGALTIGDQTTLNPIPGTIKFVDGAFLGFDGNNG